MSPLKIPFRIISGDRELLLGAFYDCVKRGDFDGSLIEIAEAVISRRKVTNPEDFNGNKNGNQEPKRVDAEVSAKPWRPYPSDNFQRLHAYDRRDWIVVGPHMFRRAELIGSSFEIPRSDRHHYMRGREATIVGFGYKNVKVQIPSIKGGDTYTLEPTSLIPEARRRVKIYERLQEGVAQQASNNNA